MQPVQSFAAAGLILSSLVSVGADAMAAEAVQDRELVIATKEAPPFAMKGGDGNWHGIGIDLWRQIGGELHLRYRFQEMATVQEVLAATANGSADAAVAAITVTAPRARSVDFTQQFYEAGLGVAVAGGAANWLPVLRTFLSLRFLEAVFALLGIALVVGALIWLFERGNNQHFGGHPARGLGAGVWWSAVAMTQAGATQGAPASLPGRFLAVVWMIASIITLAVFTAGITSAMTTQQLQGLVRNVDDLRSLRVGAVNQSSTDDFLTRRRVSHRNFADPRAGLRALQSGSIDAFAYDRPLLTWVVRQDFSALQVLPLTFDRQGYAIALPPGSALRSALDVALLEAIQSEWWRETVYRYMGAQADDAGA